MFRRKPPPFIPPRGYGQMFGQRPSVRRRAAKLAWTGAKKTIRHGHKHRRRYLPVYAAMFLAVAAEAAHWTPQGAQTVATLAVLCGPLLYGWMWLRNNPRALRWIHRKSRPVKRRAQVHAWSLFTLASLWAVAAAHYGVNFHSHTFGALLTGTLGFGFAYWWSRRVRPTVDTGEINDIQTNWRTYAAVPGGIAPGFTLTDTTVLPDPQGGPTPVGFAARLTAPKGDRFSSINTTEKIEQIAGIWDRSAADVALRPLTEHGARVGQLRVYTNNPLRQVRYWPGPQMFDPETGLAQIANYADGDRALYRFYRRGSGPTHTLIAGASEAGKSRLLDQLLGIQRHSPFMASVVIDPQEGQSLPRWKKHVALYARNVTQGMAALRAVRDEMYRRNKLLADVVWTDEKGREVEGVEHFDPISGPAVLLGLPLICLTIDELSMMLVNPEAVDILSELLKMARKCGIQIVGALQNTLVDEMGGKSTALRSLWSQGNLIVFRCDELSSKSVKGGGIEFDGSVLPPEWPDGSTTAGLCYIRGSKPRTEAARTLLVEDPYHWATTGTLTELPGVVAAYQRYLRADEEEGAETAPATTSKTPAKAETKVAQILAFLDEHGIATNAVIAEQLNILLGTVNGTLHRLHRQGRVHKVDDGMWAPLSYAAEQSDEIAA